MRHLRPGILGRFAAVLGCLLGLNTAIARAEETVFIRKFSDLKLEELKIGVVLDAVKVDPRWNIQDVRVPYIVLDGVGEAYLDARFDTHRYAYFRIPERAVVTGRLFVPEQDGEGMRAYRFTADPADPDPEATHYFDAAKWHHYDHLLSLNLPGLAWFRHQKRVAGVSTGTGNLELRRVPDTSRMGSGLDSTFDFFSGNHALDENLQLDRSFEAAGARPNQDAASFPVQVDTIRGIIVAEMDWSRRLEGRDPKLDPLADKIPGDQHAVFFPSLKAALGLLALFQGDAAPVARLFDARSIDRRDQTRYERQLGVSLADLAKFSGSETIRTIAVTGSDPYLPEGTDLAILFETDSPRELADFLKGKLEDARHANPDAIDAGGQLEGLRYFGARTPDRSLCSYVGTMGKVVLISNSPAQLKKVSETSLGKTQSLITQPEYRFFRDRYPIGVGDESAFVILSDATIRRWCGPRWRIGESRRVRASAALAEAQAANLSTIAKGMAPGTKPVTPVNSINLGPLRFGGSGVQSETYGNLNFLTPIVELPLDQVQGDESDSYARWRDTYQQNWRGFFDPIALRLVARPEKFSADLSVMPLIASSTYQPFIDVIGKVQLAPRAGDPHPGTLAHMIMAVDAESKLLHQGADFISGFLETSTEVTLGWLGKSVAVYLDDDPFWAQLMTAKNASEFFDKNGHRTPVGVTFEVKDNEALKKFLDRLGRALEKFQINWKNLEHQGIHYSRLNQSGGQPPADPAWNLYLYGSPRSLTFSLNEDLIKRVIDRDQAKLKIGRIATPWLGEGMALRANRQGIEVMGNSGRSEEFEAFRSRSWANLPILNEWKRLFPDRDPVQFHEEFWGVTLVDPCGGHYVWNDRWATMESTVFGHPGAAKTGPDKFDPTSRFRTAGFGIDFEDHGLRARTEIELTPRPSK